jgi:hypothetical protein
VRQQVTGARLLRMAEERGDLSRTLDGERQGLEQIILPKEG